MGVISMKQLLEAGVHFGHQSKKWNPKMDKYIFTERNGIHIIDLHKTLKKVEEAYEALKNIVKEGKVVLFVGTKKQAQDAIKAEAERCGMFYVNQRWLGGMLTNFGTIRKRIERLNELEKMENDGIMDLLPKKETANLKREKFKLEKNLSGIKGILELVKENRDLKSIADVIGAVFVVDTKKEILAIAEARKLGIPIIGMIDTNADPDEVDYVIPSNDDAIRSVSLISSVIANAVIEARQGSDASIKVAQSQESTETEEEVGN